jgi:hypothetical protein
MKSITDKLVKYCSIREEEYLLFCGMSAANLQTENHPHFTDSFNILLSTWMAYDEHRPSMTHTIVTAINDIVLIDGWESPNLREESFLISAISHHEIT